MSAFPSVIVVAEGLGGLAKKLGQEAARYTKAEIAGFKTQMIKHQGTTERLTHVFVDNMNTMKNVVLAKTVFLERKREWQAWPTGTHVAVPSNCKELPQIKSAAADVNLQVKVVSRWHELQLQPQTMLQNGREPAPGEIDASDPFYFEVKKPDAAAGEGTSKT